MPYLLFLKKQRNLKMSSAANYRWRFIGQNDAYQLKGSKFVEESRT